MSRVIQAVAIPVVPSPPDTAEYRKQLAESYGFKQIGEQLPDNIKIKDIINTLPKKVMLMPDASCIASLLYCLRSTCLL